MIRLRQWTRAVQAAACLLLAASSSSANGPEALDWDRNADALVLRYEERSDKLATPAAFSLEIWGDGRVVATRPFPYAAEGVRELTLSPDQVQAFLRGFLSPELVGFDAEAVEDWKDRERQDRRAEAAARGERPVLRYRSEKERVRLELHLTKYRPAGGGRPSRVDLDLAWRGLRQEREEFPDNSELAGLAAAAEACRGLLATPGPSGDAEGRR